MKLLEALLAKAHFLIIGYIAFTTYENMEAHKVKIQDVISQRSMFNSKIKKIKRNIKESKAFATNLEASRNRVTEVVGQIETIQKQLPDKTDDTSILAFLADESKILKFKKPAFNVEGEKLNDFYYAKKYSLKAKGTYLQGLIFFEHLNQHERLFNVISLDIKKMDSQKGGRFQMVDISTMIETFRHNPSYKEKTGIEEIKNKFKDSKKKKRRRRKRKKG